MSGNFHMDKICEKKCFSDIRKQAVLKYNPQVKGESEFSSMIAPTHTRKVVLSHRPGRETSGIAQ